MSEETVKPDEEKLDYDYEEALRDYTNRLMIVELPSNMDTSDDTYERYVKKALGVNHVLALINHEANLITPLPDRFESPYDMVTTWAVAVRNTSELSTINEDASKENINAYVVNSHAGRSILLCDDFWNKMCDKFATMRLIVSLYHKKDDETFILFSPVDNGENMDMKLYLHEANIDGINESRTSYIFVKGVGMLSERSLNSEE